MACSTVLAARGGAGAVQRMFEGWPEVPSCSLGVEVPGIPSIVVDNQSGMAAVVEHMIVATGRCLAGLADDPIELGPSDYIVYPGDLPHICKALEPGTTAMMVMEHTV